MKLSKWHRAGILFVFKLRNIIKSYNPEANLNVVLTLETKIFETIVWI